MRDGGTLLDQVPRLALAQSTEGLGKDISSDTCHLVTRSPILSVPSFKSGVANYKSSLVTFIKNIKICANQIFQ